MEGDAGLEPNPLLSRGVVAHYDDGTVPDPKWFEGWFGFQLWADNFPVEYPSHTRVTHHVKTGVCTFAYAVTQSGARRLLNEVGLKKFDVPFDLMVRTACEGIDGRSKFTCLTVQPQLFHSHRTPGKKKYDSDISLVDGGEDIRTEAATEWIRVSTRMNLERMLEGKPADFDQWPD